jgi:hypothetical protein
MHKARPFVLIVEYEHQKTIKLVGTLILIKHSLSFLAVYLPSPSFAISPMNWEDIGPSRREYKEYEASNLKPGHKKSISSATLPS